MTTTKAPRLVPRHVLWCSATHGHALGHDTTTFVTDADAEKLEEIIEIARSWLRGIRDDNRRGEIVYDEFAYKRREQEFKIAAMAAIDRIDTALAALRKP